jgi:hypothetical protein
LGWFQQAGTLSLDAAHHHLLSRCSLAHPTGRLLTFSPLPVPLAALLLFLLQLTLLIKDKSTLGDDKLEELKEVVVDEDVAKQIIEVRRRESRGR